MKSHGRTSRLGLQCKTLADSRIHPLLPSPHHAERAKVLALGGTSLSPHSSFKAVVPAAGAWCWQTSHRGTAGVWQQAGCLVGGATLCSPGQCVVFPDLREPEREELGLHGRAGPSATRERGKQLAPPRRLRGTLPRGASRLSRSLCKPGLPGVLSLLGVTL